MMMRSRSVSEETPQPTISVTDGSWLLDGSMLCQLEKKMVVLELIECLNSTEFVFFSFSDSCSEISAVHKALAEEQGQLKVTQ